MQPRPHLISLPLIYLLLACNGEGVRCREVTLSPRPGWVSSGAWMKNGAELVVVDARSREMLSFDPQGKGFVGQPLTQAFQSSSPMRVASDLTSRKLFVELERGRFATLDSGRAFPIDWKNLFKQSLVGQTPSNYRLDNLYLWAPVDTDIIAYASIKTGPESWLDGFVRFPLENPHQIRFLKALNREASKIFYKLGHPLISSLGDTGYLLFLDSSTPSLYLNRKGSDKLERMNALDMLYKDGKNEPPLLPSFIRPADFTAVMQAVERSSMPVGLYGWDNYLYTLFRGTSGGGTKWVMVKIDPEDSQVISTFDIPTKAHHLTVVPGPKEWAFIEKGPVRGHKDQDVNSVLFVPASRIQTASKTSLCR